MAKKEIVISADKSNGTTRIALVENGELAELHVETPHHERTLGDIALGKVKKVMPSIRAAFVDIGQKQDAFLHFSDLSDNLAQQLAFVEQDNPEIASIRIRRRVRLARVRRHRVNARRARRKGSVEDALERLFRTRRRAIKPRPSASGRKKAQLPDFNATDRPEECLKRDQRILVKIVKEPISSKGSRVSTDISLAGRFLVLVPLADYVAVSKKISSYKERRRLRALARSLVPDGFGVIIRTQAEGKNARALDTDLRLLVEKWRKIESKLAGKPRPPVPLYEDVNMVSSMVRDLFSDDYDRILIDDPKVYRNVKGYVQAVAPSMADAVQLYEGKKSVFETSGLQNAVREAFESRVNLPSGGYLFFERTEAMHVVDVNSGRSGRGLSQEENSLRVNVEAARVIARQMRLRDLGGIMCVDFIDLRDDKNRRKVYDEFKKEFRKDRAVTKLLPMSDFGIVQITRQRLRPALTTLHTAEEVTGDGGGMVDEEPPAHPPVLEAPEPQPAARPAPRAPREKRSDESPDALVERMGRWVSDYKQKGGKSGLTLRVHPFLCAFLNRRVPNWPTRWSFRHLVRIRVEEDASMSPHEFAFVPAQPEAFPSAAEAASVRAAKVEAAPVREETPAPAPQPERRRGDRPSGEASRKSEAAPSQSTPDTPDTRDTADADTDAKDDPPQRRSQSRGGRGSRGGQRSRSGSPNARTESGDGGERSSRSRSQRAGSGASSPSGSSGNRGSGSDASSENATADGAAPRKRRRRGGRNRRRGGRSSGSGSENGGGAKSSGNDGNTAPGDG